MNQARKYSQGDLIKIIFYHACRGNANYHDTNDEFKIDYDINQQNFCTCWNQLSQKVRQSKIEMADSANSVEVFVENINKLIKKDLE